VANHKKIVWDSTKVAFFWTTYLNSQKNHGAWMSEGSGDEISKRMTKILPKGFFSSQKTICDWGCGTATFAKVFSSKGHIVFGLDQPEIVSQIETDQANFSPIANSHDIENAQLDLIYALEVIEHIIESDLTETFSEWKRILKEGGYLLLTTPHDEDLESNSIVCPNCETEFHSVQHVRSFTSKSITDLLLSEGFEVENIWLGEFFFSTKRGQVIETIRKTWFIIRRLRENQKTSTKQPHMMVLCKYTKAS
jgi:2-polyprenyl-3-methyl-5-hydroxy-6-metoxy-1,4-benzoquinol methylase